MTAKKTTEDYERLLKELAQQRDDASAVANRALQENKILRQDVLHGMELLTALLRGDTTAAPEAEADRITFAFKHGLHSVGYTGGDTSVFVRQLVDRHFDATNLLRAVQRAKSRPSTELMEHIKAWVLEADRK